MDGRSFAYCLAGYVPLLARAGGEEDEREFELAEGPIH